MFCIVTVCGLSGAGMADIGWGKTQRRNSLQDGLQLIACIVGDIEIARSIDHRVGWLQGICQRELAGIAATASQNLHDFPRIRNEEVASSIH